MLKKVCFAILLLFLLILNSCVLVPFIDSYKNMGVTESDRQALFAKQYKEYQNNIFWGDYNKALSFASEGAALLIKESFKGYKEKKILGHEIEDTTFSDSSKAVKVNVAFKYFKMTEGVVKIQNVEEVWEFSMGKWYIKERTILSGE